MRIRTKKRICIAMGLMLFLVTLGIVGGMEWGDITIRRGAILAVLSELAGAAFLYKAGVLKL